MIAAANNTATTQTGARCAIATNTSGSLSSTVACPASAIEDMGKRGMPREKVLATVVSLRDRTPIRVGNGEYVKENGSDGLTTLRTRHLEVNGTELRFHFKGKSGKTWRLHVRDRRIARVVRSNPELPGPVPIFGR
jgi:DNA topoisomerase I